jgi:hypothetical protein
MTKRILALACGLVIVAGVAWGDQQANDPTTPLAVTAVSGSVTFASTVESVHFTNDGANPAIVRVFVTCETIGDIVTTDTRARSIKPGEAWGLDFRARDRLATCTPTAANGFGYIGFSAICTGALTTSLRWFAK